MSDLAREAFSANNFRLAADIYERDIQENGPTSELFLGLADSLARGGLFAKAFQSYKNAYSFGEVDPDKLKHLVVGLVDTVKQKTTNSDNIQIQKNFMFICGLCQVLLIDPVTLPCGHTFCRTCTEKDKSKTCGICGVVHHRLKVRNLNSNVLLANLVDKWFPKKSAAALLNKKGNECFSAQDYKNAVDAYSQAIEISRTDHLLLSNRCHGYILMDKFEDALADSEQVVLLHPNWPKGYFHKGCALYGLGRYEDAVVSFLQCLSLDQNVSSAKDYLAKTLDRILSVAASNAPKTETLHQQYSLTLLQHLIECNFSQVTMLPNIITLSNLAYNVNNTVNTPEVSTGAVVWKQQEQGCATKANIQKNNVEEAFTHNIRCNVLSKCGDGGHSKSKSMTPEPHPPSPNSRKRLRNPSLTQCQVSPTHSSLQKVLKPAKDKVRTSDTLVVTTSSVTVNAQTQPTAATICSSAGVDEIKPELTNIDDLECGLCYRLFYEPVTTPCGHTFCRKCLDRCLDHTITCPMCKGNLAEYLAERRQAITDAIQCIIETYFKEAYTERCKLNEEEMIELIRMGSDQQSDIPVFVCILAFPTILCPLHVYEPRYRLMIRRCMESGTQQFGMCMSFSDNDNDFSDYGCMLEIRDVQYFPDGRSVVDTIGGRRFKVLSRGKRDGYNTAKVEFISDKPIDADEIQDVNDLQAELHAMVKDWLSRLPTGHRTRIIQHFGEIPDMDLNSVPSPNGPKWAWWAIAVLPMDPRVQMAFLVMSSLQERLISLKKVLLHMMKRRGMR